MSTANKLTYLNTTKQKIKDGINALGGELTNQSTFRSYANVLNDLYEVFPKVESEETTSSITLSPTQKAKMSLTLKGNIEQDGEPTPTTPVDIHIVSGDNEIKVEGKNLLNTTLMSEFTPTRTTWYSLDGVADFYNVSNIARSNLYYDLKANTTYTFSVNEYKNINTSLTSPIQLVRGDNAGSVCALRSSSSFEPVSFTPTEDLRVYPRISVSTANVETQCIVQLEVGSTATDYVEHKEYTKEINLGELEVGSIGDYDDEFFKNTIDSEYYDSTLEQDKWYLKKRIGKVVLDGSEEWGLANNVFYKSNNKGLQQTGIKIVKSNYFQEAYNQPSTSNVNTYNSDNSICGSSVGTNRFYIKCTSITSTENFKTWLSTHNTIVYYVLATPENILLNDTLQETLDSFYSWQEQTNISQSNFDLPFKIKASALKDFTTLE